jgi:hypothetical protein
MGSQKNNFAAQRLKADTHRRKVSPLLVAAHVARRHDPAVGRQFFSDEKRKAIAIQRRETLRRFERLKKKHSATEASRLAGSSVPTLWRWQQLFQSHELAGLLPKTSRCGRHSPFKHVRFTLQAVRELELLLVEHSNPRDAWRQFAKSPGCPPLVVRAVQRLGRAPAPLAGVGRISLVQALCYVSSDGRRLFVKLPVKGVLTAQLAVPAKFNFVRMKK